MKIIKSKKFALIVALVLAFFVIVFWKQFSAFAQSVIDSFTTTDKIDDTWNVEVDTTNGEVKLAEQSCDAGTWFCGTGYDDVCTNTLGDGDYILVALADESSTKQWKTANTNCDLPECGQDGGQDGDNLVADNTISFSSYPARDACKTIGGRLPTVSELQCIYANMATFGDNFNTSSSYWSSTEYLEAYASNVSFDNGNAYNNYKTGLRLVRCVQGW